MGNTFLEKGLPFPEGQAPKRPTPALHLSSLGGINRILLMTTTAIGDTLFSTPAIRAVKESYPDKEVHVLGHVRSHLLLQENPYLDRLLLYRGKRKGIIELIRELEGNAMTWWLFYTAMIRKPFLWPGPPRPLYYRAGDQPICRILVQ